MFYKNVKFKITQISHGSIATMCRSQIAKPHLYSNAYEELSFPPDYRQNANEQTIGEATPSLEEQTNSMVAQSEKRKNDDAIADCGKNKDACI